MQRHVSIFPTEDCSRAGVIVVGCEDDEDAFFGSARGHQLVDDALEREDYDGGDTVIAWEGQRKLREWLRPPPVAVGTSPVVHFSELI